MFRRTFVLLALALTVVAAAAGPVAAGRGGGNGPKGPNNDSTITLDQAQPISYGDTVTFTVHTSKTNRPFVTVECSKAGDRVYYNTVGMFQEWYDEFGEPDSVLSSLAWIGGDADCVGTLWYQDRRYKKRSLASTEFHVYG